MKLLLLCGSLRSGSTNEAVLRTVQQVAPTDVDAIFFGGLGALPHFNPDDDREPLPAPVAELRAAIDAADALLVCIPEYAGDMPGSFKNLLDWTVGGGETTRKPVGWINASTAPQGAAGAHGVLRTVLTYTDCDVVDAACADIPVSRPAILDDVVTEPGLRAEIAAVVQTLMEYAASAS